MGYGLENIQRAILQRQQQEAADEAAKKKRLGALVQLGGMALGAATGGSLGGLAGASLGGSIGGLVGGTAGGLAAGDSNLALQSISQLPNTFKAFAPTTVAEQPVTGVPSGYSLMSPDDYMFYQEMYDTLNWSPTE